MCIHQKGLQSTAPYKASGSSEFGAQNVHRISSVRNEYKAQQAPPPPPPPPPPAGALMSLVSCQRFAHRPTWTTIMPSMTAEMTPAELRESVGPISTSKGSGGGSLSAPASSLHMSKFGHAIAICMSAVVTSLLSPVCTSALASIRSALALVKPG